MGAGQMKQAISSFACLAGLAACASTQGASPASQIPGPENTVVVYNPNYPQIAQAETRNNSLWSAAPISLLSMRRAKAVGDLLTIVVEMDDRASVQSSLSRSRDSQEGLTVGALFGLPSVADTVLPGSNTLSPGVDINRNSTLDGTGSVNRADRATFTLSARVVGVEPNGNLMIQGYQQTQISAEVRYLSVSGVIRSQDISRKNTVSYEKIADARLTYVSEGEAGSPVRRGLIPRVVDRVAPF